MLQSISPCEEYAAEHEMVEKSAASILKKIEESKK
jgi:glutamate mutase epsilon subunit